MPVFLESLALTCFTSAENSFNWNYHKFPKTLKRSKVRSFGPNLVLSSGSLTQQTLGERRVIKVALLFISLPYPYLIYVTVLVLCSRSTGSKSHRLEGQTFRPRRSRLKWRLGSVWWSRIRGTASTDLTTPLCLFSSSVDRRSRMLVSTDATCPDPPLATNTWYSTSQVRRLTRQRR